MDRLLILTALALAAAISLEACKSASTAPAKATCVKDCLVAPRTPLAGDDAPTDK